MANVTRRVCAGSASSVIVQVSVVVLLLTITLNKVGAFLVHNQASLEESSTLNQEKTAVPHPLADENTDKHWSSPVNSISSASKRSPARVVGYRQVDAYACSRRLSQLSCIMGCQRCTEVYGRRVYRMADCCVRCQATQASMVDDGPEHCSLDFFNTDLLQRYHQ